MLNKVASMVHEKRLQEVLDAEWMWENIKIMVQIYSTHLITKAECKHYISSFRERIWRDICIASVLWLAYHYAIKHNTIVHFPENILL